MAATRATAIAKTLSAFSGIEEDELSRGLLGVLCSCEDAVEGEDDVRLVIVAIFLTE